MKNSKEIDIDQALKNYLATISPEQLIAELETPQRAVLMAIPDEDFFHIPNHTVKAWEIDQTITLIGDLCLRDSSIWKNPKPALVQTCSASLIAENEELALAA